MKAIDITSEMKRFNKHLKNNPRTIFSAQFGDGKTYFLTKYMEKHEKDTLFLVLHPVNYSVASNEDVFEYIKRDILVELASKEEFREVEWREVAKTLWDYDTLLEENEYIFSEASPIVKAVFTPFRLFKKVDDKYAIDKYFDRFKNLKGSIFEQDHFSVAIKATINRIHENKKKCVLIIEDLDRIDPGHLFRILNVLGAHIDEDAGTNKFGFDNIVAVLDYNKTAHIFHHFYGNDANYSGYMSKFICQNFFEYSIIKEARNQLIQFVRNECKLDDHTIMAHEWENRTSQFDHPTISRHIYTLSVRDIVRALDVKNISKEREVLLAMNQKVNLQSVPLINLLALFMRMDFQFSTDKLIQMLMSSKAHFQLLGNAVCVNKDFNGTRIICSNADMFTIHFMSDQQHYIGAQYMYNTYSGTLEGKGLHNAIASVLSTLCRFVNDCKYLA